MSTNAFSPFFDIFFTSYVSNTTLYSEHTIIHSVYILLTEKIDNSVRQKAHTSVTFTQKQNNYYKEDNLLPSLLPRLAHFHLIPPHNKKSRAQAELHVKVQNNMHTQKLPT